MEDTEGEYRKKSDCISCRLATDRDGQQTYVDAVRRMWPFIMTLSTCPFQARIFHVIIEKIYRT